jgi:hypothetical protein
VWIVDMDENEIFAKLALFKKEIDNIRKDWDIAAIGHTGKNAIEVHRKMNAALLERIRLHERELAFMSGDKIEPEVHFGEAVLLPVGGMG